MSASDNNAVKKGAYHQLEGPTPADYGYLTSAKFIKHMIKGMGADKATAQICAFEVAPDKVAAIKEQATQGSDVPFVSTNDILTSHFFGASNASLGMMTINQRGRVLQGQLTDLHAGNYKGTLILDPTNYEQAADIREALTKGPPFTRQRLGPPLPGFCGKCPGAFISNWASFPFKLEFTTTLHLPLLPPMKLGGDFKSYPMDVALVFRPQPGKLAVLYITKRASRANLTASGSPLGASVSDTIFPPP